MTMVIMIQWLDPIMWSRDGGGMGGNTENNERD